ncbi:MAG: glycosyltransferase, partial [Bryobacteraceae bacterium]
MILVFWIGALWLVYVYLGYPLMLAMLVPFHRVKPKVRTGFSPKVSILIAARNEEKDIGWKVAETLGWDYPANCLEVLVASDASEDGTDEIVAAFRDPRVTLIRLERGGKQRALNRLTPLATGELLFFTDANAHIAPGCLRHVVCHFADSRVGCVTGDSWPLRDIQNAAVAGGALAYSHYQSWIKRLENCIGSVLVCDGAIFCIRRELYPPLSPELANDLEIPMRIGHAGYWVHHEPQAIVWERETNSRSQEFSRRRRVCAQGMLGMWRLRHTLLGLRGWQFVSQKFLRWLSVIPLAMLLISAFSLARGSTIFQVLLWLQVAVYGLALAGMWLSGAEKGIGRLASVPFYAVLGSIGALVG